jgi:hypothetical protein
MNVSISRVLYLWMRERRVIGPAAKRLGMSTSALAAELRCAKHQAKLGADRLVPLFDALRAMNYGGELDGILDSFVRELRGGDTPTVSQGSYRAQLMTLMKCIGVLSESSSQIRDAKSQRELQRLKTMIRAEIIPAVYKLEDIIDRRLARLQKRNQTVIPDLPSSTSQAGA